MRKVLVCGAAFAATCIAAVAMTGGAEATAPTPDPGSSSPAVSGPPESRTPPGSSSPSGPAASNPQAPGRQAAAPDPVVSTRAVMVTPKPPKTATYDYGIHPRQTLDAYWKPYTSPAPRPEGQEGEPQEPGQDGGRAQQARKPPPTPAVLLFHGGSWISGDKSSWKYFARRLNAQGYTVFAANYRLARHAAWPAQRDDAMAALAFVKRNAAKWNIDPDRVVAFGSSAGGLLADQLATYGEGGTRVRGAISLSPVNAPLVAFQDGEKPDAMPSQRRLREAVVQLLGCVPAETDPICWAQANDSDTTTHVTPGDAPMLLLHYRDEFVPPSQSTGLATALRGVGLPSTVKVYPGKDHATTLLTEESALPAILTWLRARTAD